MFKPFKGIKGTVLESRLLPGNFRRFPGYFRRFSGYFRLFPGYFCLFPGHFRARCFQLWTDFSPFVIIPHKKQRHIIYDMMVARFAGGGGNLSAANWFFSLR